MRWGLGIHFLTRNKVYNSVYKSDMTPPRRLENCDSAHNAYRIPVMQRLVSVVIDPGSLCVPPLIGSVDTAP